MENKIILVVGILMSILAIVLIVKPICFYKIQEAVMGLFGMKVEYSENKLGMGRLVGIFILAITVFGVFMQLS